MTFSGPDWSVWVYDSSFEPPITPICATGKNTISVTSQCLFLRLLALSHHSRAPGTAHTPAGTHGEPAGVRAQWP